MAVKSRTYLKTKFESGDTPVQQDFFDLLDSVYIKAEDYVEYIHSKSDWNEIDEDSEAFILNKPVLGSAALVDSTTFAPALGTDDNYVTDSEKTVIQSIPAVNLSNAGKSLKIKTDGTGHEYQPDFVSSGIVSAAPTITNVGLTLTITSSVVRLYATSDFSGALKQYTVPQSSVVITDNVVNYIYVDYNNGTPIYKNTTNVDVITESNTIPINTLLATNGNIHYSHWDTLANGLSNKLHRRFVKTQRYARESGLDLTYSGTTITISEGIVWRGARDFHLQQTKSDGSNSSLFFLYYHDASVWTSNLVTGFNYTQFDDGTNLQTGGLNKYLINWVFRGIEDHQHGYIVLGTKNYKDLPDAQAENKLPPLPLQISSHAILVGRIIVKYNTPATVYKEGAFETEFSGSVINDHNSLSELQGGITTERYHLTAAQSSLVANLRNITTVSSTPYTILTTDFTILVDATLGDVTLDTTNVYNVNNFIFVVKKIDSSTNKVIIGGLVDDVTNFSILDQYGSVMIQSNGTQMFMLTSNMIP